MHLYDSGSTDLDRSLLVGGQDISCGNAVAYLGYGVFANSQTLNKNLAVFVGLKGLVIAVITRHTE